MRYEVIIEERYCIGLKRQSRFRLTYSVSEGPTAGTERWFLVGMEDLGLPASG